MPCFHYAKNMSTLQERIAEVIAHSGLSVSEIAKECGVTSGAVSQWKDGPTKSLKPAPAARLAERTGFSALWIATGEGGKWRVAPSATPIDLESNPDYPAVRRVRLRLSAGIEGFAVEADVEDGAPIVFKRDWFVRHGYKAESLVAIGVKGSSMEPGMYDGDTVVINTAQQEPRDGRVFAINYEGELVIKRLQRDEGEWWMESDNPDQRRYPRKRFTEGAFIIGEIVHKQSERI